DASFLVGLESDDEALLMKLDAALERPRWQLFLGRKSFVPSEPMRVGVRSETSLEEALQSEKRLRCVIETLDSSATEVRHDLPLSFSERRFTIRYVKTTWIECPKGEKTDET